jgi:dGTPase
LKYPNARQPGSKKWGVFETESADFEYARRLLPDDSRRSAEAEIMDWADDIAYAVHDADDFFRAGLVPLDRLKHQARERDRFLDGAFVRWREDGPVPRTKKDEAQAALELVVSLFPLVEPFGGSTRERAELRSFSATLIARFVDAIRLRVPVTNQESRVEIRSEVRMEVDLLKELIWEYIILRPSLSTQQAGQRRVVCELFEAFFEAAESNDRSRYAVIPPAYRGELSRLMREARNDAERTRARARVVADIVSGLTEDQAFRLHQRMMGGGGSVLDQIVS